MYQVKQESPYAPLAAEWAAEGVPSAQSIDSTREVLAVVRPGDLPEALPLVDALLARLPDPAARSPARRSLLALLDGVRRRAFTTALPQDAIEPWFSLVLRVARAADYTLGDLLRSREETDPRTVALRVLGADGGELSVADLSRRTRAIARGVLALVDGDPDAKVAILSENCLEAALCDLACLSNGIVDFPLPANAVPEQIVYMLKHSGARILLVSDDEQVSKVLPSLAAMPGLKDVVVFSKETAERHGLLSLEQMVSQGAEFDDGARAERAARVRASDVATVMYTSGTTGKPKGIVFTHENLLSKRFARAFALPHVNEGDVFLAYLPLYHTFGRWLELTGSLFWGATYVFARSTAQASLLEDFRRVKPTVFISVPKKWMELHEAAVWEAGSDDPDELVGHLRAITGGRLRHGLSAAGYLDPGVFKAFHAAGTELCSGYGMTEATGGITMTPPGEYVDDSIGKPLPGVECRRADDGELLIRGPYVSPGYYKPGAEEKGLDAEGWFATGDLVAIDPAGHFRITGRKKEIYKNRQGQTIAPQRIENLFRDFEAIAQAFLVGDHREYNTLLVWPNHASPAVEGHSPDQVRELLSSLVASANRFLAPFERVVAFQVLPRALDAEHGEMTHKHTFRREVVEKEWKPLIERMYEQKHLAFQVDGTFLRIPNWVLREMGVLQHEVSLADGVLHAGDRSLSVGRVAEAPGALRLGDLAYVTEATVLDLGALLSRPALWLGNEGLRVFLGDEAFASLVSRRRKGGGDLRLDARWWPPPAPERLRTLLAHVDGELTFSSLHAAAELLRAERPEARKAMAHLHLGLGTPSVHATLCRALLRRAAEAPDEDVRRRAFRVLIPHEDPGDTLETLRLFLDRFGPLALRDEDLADLGEKALTEAQLDALLAHLATDKAIFAPGDASDRRLLVCAMRLATATAIARPVYFAKVRMRLARLTLHDDSEIAARAAEELDRLRRGFSNWVGPNLRLAIDPQTGAEYGWKDVLVFDDNVPPAAAHHLLQALSDSTLVRASIFQLGRGVLLSLADIPPGGATITLLARQHGKSVYRLSIHTRSREVFDVAINVADDMNFAELREEVNWLLAAGAPPPLVEQFGGYFAEWGIFTEEFIPGATVEKQVARLVRQGEAKRLKLLWPFLAWTALEGHLRFWDRTGRRLALREPSPQAFIVPSHDYHAGARLVSISDRTACTGLDELLDRFQHAFVSRIEASRPELRGEVDDGILLSAVVEALGLERGMALLAETATAQDSRHAVAIETFLERVRAEGFTPQRVFFAVRRFRRWLEVNPAATLEARGKMLLELWGTYRLSEVEGVWPDTRIRFFRRTVFADARPALGEALDRLMARARTLPPGGLDLEEQVAGLRGGVAPTAEEDWFLARLTFRYLAPTDEVALISMPSGGHYVTEVVVALADEEGNRFTVRAPVSPREVARLLHMFHDANLHVAFGAEHEYLICLDARETPIGGLFYRQVDPERIHMEKLVVARKHRGKGVADGLMKEFVRRLAARGVRHLETGYFQPEYLRRYGFRTDPTSGGLVRDVAPETRES